MAVRDESLGLLCAAQVAVGQAEDANGSFGQRVALGRPTADRVVLGEDDPVVLAGVSQPNLIGEELGALLA